MQQGTEGTVTEALPGPLFRVSISPERQVLAHLAGKMRLHRIRVLPGDRVLVELCEDEGGGESCEGFKAPKAGGGLPLKTGK
jgi:translation initiation factor IF-1